MTAGTSLHVLSALALSLLIAPSLWGQESGAGRASELSDIYAAPARRVAAVPLRETPAPNIDGVLQVDTWSANVRFAWLNRAGTGLFIVYNEAQGFSSLSGPLSRALIVKFNYMLTLWGG